VQGYKLGRPDGGDALENDLGYKVVGFDAETDGETAIYQPIMD